MNRFLPKATVLLIFAHRYHDDDLHCLIDGLYVAMMAPSEIPDRKRSASDRSLSLPYDRRILLQDRQTLRQVEEGGQRNCLIIPGARNFSSTPWGTSPEQFTGIAKLSWASAACLQPVWLLGIWSEAARAKIT